jgi:hypothetical protein
MCTTYDTTRAGKATVKVRDIHNSKYYDTLKKWSNKHHSHSVINYFLWQKLYINDTVTSITDMSEEGNSQYP